MGKGSSGKKFIPFKERLILAYLGDQFVNPPEIFSFPKTILKFPEFLSPVASAPQILIFLSHRAHECPL
jgi:hypothetical protein